MTDLPHDLARLGDALEHAVARAIGRRRVQLRAAWALGAVVVTVPMALAAAGLYVRTGESSVSTGSTPTAVPSIARAHRDAEPARPFRPQRGRRMPARAAGGGGRGAVHPLDLIPPPVGARAARTYDAGVATERVDRRPPFALQPL